MAGTQGQPIRTPTVTFSPQTDADGDGDAAGTGVGTGRGPGPRSLLERRLVIVTGKGGVGKTTVCAALARGAAAAGRRVLTVELGRDAEHPALLGGTADSLLLDPHEALAEYLELQVGFGGVVRRVLGHRGFRQLLEGAPGWRELICIGKIWQLVERADPERGPNWVVVDAPATGHGLTFLDVPRVATRAVRSGPLHRHAGWVEALLVDPERTLILPVARPEELAALECRELVVRLREELGLPMDRVVLNAAVDDPGAPTGPVVEALEGCRDVGEFPWRAAFEDWEVRWQRTLRLGDELARGCELPVVGLPFAPDADADDLEALGAILLAELRAPA